MTANVMQLALAWVLAAGTPAGEPASLQLHLPRSVRVRGEQVRLGSLGVLHGDETLKRKASVLAMGRAPWPGEQLTVDRRTIASRLAAGGIDLKDVRITGAQQVVVTRNETIVPSDRLVQAAQSFIEGRDDTPPGMSWRLARGPEDLVVPTTDPIKLDASAAASPEGCLLVQVAVLSSRGEAARAEVLFKQVYEVRQTFATRDIAAGEVLTSENVEVRTIAGDRPVTTWVSPFGQITARAVSAGSAIAPALLRPVEAVVVVERNSSVQMRIVGAGFSVTGLGQALEDGRPGDLIRVRNVDSKRIVTARVGADGTVCPVYDRGQK